MKIQACASCAFAERIEEETRLLLFECRRFPPGAEKLGDGWCGEWRADSEKTCRHAGRVMFPAHEGSQIRSRYGTFVISLPTPEARQICLRPKGHVGDHSDGIEDWSTE